ncbi:MAG: PAS domain S-box protein, partial [Gammaproteobacteria bacterium]|nr:PAS domain S-box protein [Gammaproteobacteria bacterium]
MINWLLAGLTLVFLMVWKLPESEIMQNIVLMSLPTHMFAETFSIVVSMLVFAMVFSTSKEKDEGHLIILASAFFIIGMLDFAHTLSYRGMPDFVTPGSADKSIYFWLVARYVAAIALTITALQRWKNRSYLPNLYWVLLVCFALTGLFYWVGLYHLDSVPRSFIPGKGLTTFKLAAEYGIITILIIPAVLFYLQVKKQNDLDASGLYAATVITILSELCFTLYGNITGLFILLGHIYKVIAYIFIFRAIFLYVVREPYRRLAESDQYNRTLFESCSIGLALTDMSGKLLDINQSYADIIGRSIKETKKLSYWEITPKKYNEQEKKQLLSLTQNKAYGPYEKEYIHKRGHHVAVRLSGRIIERKGSPYIWSSVENISEQRASDRARYETEQSFLQLVEHIREVFWLTDAKKNSMVYISPAYEVVWGRSCESLYQNPQSFVDAIHEDDRQRVLQALTDQDKKTYREEYRIFQPDGTLRWIRDESYPVRDLNGDIYRVAGIAEDITEEKLSHELLERRVFERTEMLHKKEQELILAKDEAERANAAKTEFLSRMSHELRTPLNAILGFSQLLQMDHDLNTTQTESVGEILGGGRHLLNLVNEVLDLAKIETGDYELELTQVNAAGVLKECIS